MGGGPAGWMSVGARKKLVSVNLGDILKIGGHGRRTRVARGSSRHKASHHQGGKNSRNLHFEALVK